MGTRHLIAICIDGKYPIAQYGQWDGYPEGQGVKVLQSLKGKSLAKLKAGASLAVAYTEDNLRQVYIDLGIDPDSQWITMEDSHKVNKAHPQLDRSMGAKIIAFVRNQSQPYPVLNDLDFAQDSLFCEWAYVIDFDTNTFEVFKGFNHTPLTEGERFYKADKSASDEYHAVKLVATFDLLKLPSKEAFLDTFKEADEDEENEPSPVESL